MATPKYDYSNQSNAYQDCGNAAIPQSENMGSTLNGLNEFAKSARTRARDIEARLLGNPNIAKDSCENKLQTVQSVADVIAETRSLVGQTLDILDRIQAQL